MPIEGRSPDADSSKRQFTPEFKTVNNRNSPTWEESKTFRGGSACNRNVRVKAVRPARGTAPKEDISATKLQNYGSSNNVTPTSDNKRQDSDTVIQHHPALSPQHQPPTPPGTGEESPTRNTLLDIKLENILQSIAFESLMVNLSKNGRSLTL